MGSEKNRGKTAACRYGSEKDGGKTAARRGGVKRKERSASMACLQTKPIKREVRREREEKK